MGHNVYFDRRMLRAECDRAGLDQWKVKCFDTLALSKCFHRGLGVKNSLGNLTKIYGIDEEQEYRALDDVKLTIKLWRKLCGDANSDEIFLAAVSPQRIILF